jgi:hypothetical protein
VSPDAAIIPDLPLEDIRNDPNAHLAVVHAPAPFDQLHRRFFLIPVPEIYKRCPRATVQGKEAFHFEGNISGQVTDIWSELLIDIDNLPRWLSAMPAWKDPVPPAPRRPDPVEPALESKREAIDQLEAALGRLWTCSEIERVSRGRVVIAEDRIRLDSVTLLIHDLGSGRIAGLHIRTSFFPPSRRIHFEVKRHGSSSTPCFT